MEGSWAKPSPNDYALLQYLVSETDAQLKALHGFDDLHVQDRTALKLDPPAARLGRLREDRD